MISMRDAVRRCSRALLGCALGLAWSANATAGLVRTEEVAHSQQAASAREKVRAMAQRPELANQLKAVGVAPDQVEDRVNAMTDAEVIALADQLDRLPAGGALSNNELVLILVIIILVLVL
jgi:hypothetical protein